MWIIDMPVRARGFRSPLTSKSNFSPWLKILSPAKNIVLANPMLQISILILRWILKLLQRSNSVSCLENLRRKKKSVLPSALQQKDVCITGDTMRHGDDHVSWMAYHIPTVVCLHGTAGNRLMGRSPLAGRLLEEDMYPRGFWTYHSCTLVG